MKQPKMLEVGQLNSLELTICEISVMGTLTFCGELGGDDDGDELFVLLRAGVGGA